MNRPRTDFIEVKVFLSHSSDDKPLARRIASQLKERGIHPWLDEAEIRVGHSIPDKIAEGISQSQVFCILISKSSNASKWVAREYNAFLPRIISGAASVVPCKLDNSQIPILLADIKYADFSISFEAGLTALLDAVHIREAAARFELVQKLGDALLSTASPAALEYLLADLGKYSWVRNSKDGWDPLLRQLEEIGITKTWGSEPGGGGVPHFTTDLGEAVFHYMATHRER